jgi:nitronate monooxygenase
MSQPQIIQGGMGVAVSGWRLARTVSQLRQLGVVSGTALAVMLSRRLQAGDLDGQMRHGLAHFPYPAIAKRVLDEHFIPGGKAPDQPFRLTPMPTLTPRPSLVELTVVANFVEVFLAKEGHSGPVGINFLEKIQLPALPSLFGAMLANVDYVLMGAGIPRAIPGLLDRLAAGEDVTLRVDVQGAAAGEEHLTRFSPREFCAEAPRRLQRPQFLGIVASATLALTLAKKSNGRVDGFVVEGETAGGHNAPPRGPLKLTPEGEPLYGPRDVPELDKIAALGLPFWLAGSYGRPGGLADALRAGATGIQVGTAFAFCEESGIDPELKRQVIELSRQGRAGVFTDPVASPTGFPFKVVQLAGTLSAAAAYDARERICDLGYLRHLYVRPDRSIGYRCPSEPVENYLRKGGKLEETVGRKCVCNGLPATVGSAQARADGTWELPLMTAGNEVANVAQFLAPGRSSYTAAEVIAKLLAGAAAPPPLPTSEPAEPRRQPAEVAA